MSAMAASSPTSFLLLASSANGASPMIHLRRGSGSRDASASSYCPVLLRRRASCPVRFSDGDAGGLGSGFRPLGFGIRASAGAGSWSGGGEETAEASDGMEEADVDEEVDKLKATIEKSKKLLAMQDTLLKQMAKRREFISSIGRDIVKEREDTVHHAGNDETSSRKQDDSKGGSKGAYKKTSTTTAQANESKTAAKSAVSYFDAIAPYKEKKIFLHKDRKEASKSSFLPSSYVVRPASDDEKDVKFDDLFESKVHLGPDSDVVTDEKAEGPESKIGVLPDYEDAEDAKVDELSESNTHSEPDYDDVKGAEVEDIPESKIHLEPDSGDVKDADIEDLSKIKSQTKDSDAEELVEAKEDTVVVSDDANSAEENKDSAPLAGVNVMYVIVVAAECAPWSKTGGLGDVAGTLPKALARRGHRVMVVAPRYGDYSEPKDLGIRKYYKAAGQDMEVNYFHAYIDGVDFVFIDAPPFRHRENNIYGGDSLEILKRMILFCKAAVEVPWHVPCGGICYGDGNLVFIANDWHTALLPVYLKAYYRDNGLMQYTRSILVIHNIAHQGRGPVDNFQYMDLPDHYIDHFTLYDPVGGDHANIFAAGLKTADRVVTVSHGYAWELKTVEGGWGLHEIINHNHWKFHGIVNGIDTREWNPEFDMYLRSDGYTNYSLKTVETGKRQCKAALQKQLSLAVRDDVPIIAFIGRLDYQKGVDLIAEAMPWIVGQDVQLVMLGAGRPDLENMLRRFEGQHRDKVRGWVGFSVQLAHRITAGADILVMPSRFEPCGLNQLYAMMYGTIPVVHAVGGLRDTVTPFDPFNDAGLGWTFDSAEPNKLINALGHSLNTFRNYKESWKGLQARGMTQDLSWDHAAELYEKVLVAAKYQW